MVPSNIWEAAACGKGDVVGAGIWQWSSWNDGSLRMWVVESGGIGVA